MNCLEFERQIEVLARGTLADARTRAAAEAHGESCSTCAARLADERALSVGLGALAAEMKTAEASAHVEAALVAAFRARAASAVAKESNEAVANRVVVPVSGHVPVRRWSWAKTIAAASMAAAASLALFVLVKPDMPERAMIVPPSESVGDPPSKSGPRDNSSQGVKAEVRSAPTPQMATVTSPRPGFAPRPRTMPVSSNGSRGSRSAFADAGRTQEVATEFIPLVQSGAYTQAEEGHLVRVELPRSALASFGLPVNAEAPAGRVKADVLMGQDGIARAIRFVR